MIMRCSLLFSILLAGTVSVLGLKGSFPRRVERRLRVLQGPPAPKEGEVSAGEPKAGETKAVEPKAGEPKAGETKADGPKDGERPKGKKCKKAPKVSPPTQTVADAPDSSPTADDDAPFCLQGEASAEECQAAKGGKLPKGHKSIHGNAEIRVSYLTGTKVEDVLNMVEEVIRSETAAEFLGCDSIEETASRKYRRWQQEEEAAEEEENLRVTGVDFQKVEISDEDCEGFAESDRQCDTIQSKVEIFYLSRDNGEITPENEEEMWALLRTTIEEQAASGAFDSVGMVESVELVNSNETDSTTDGDSEGGGGLGTGAIAGIPSAVGGIVAIAIAGFVIYKMLGSDKDDENNGNDQNDAVNNSDGIVEAQAVVMDDEGQNEKDCVWQKSKNQFL